MSTRSRPAPSNPSLINHGVIEHVPPGLARRNTAPRTIIVSGLGRSGTSMLAALLLEAGVHLGEFLADAVHEDRELLELFGRGDPAALRRAIRDRDVLHDVWGFKLPNLHRYMHHADIGLFRNACLVITLRDIVAVAVRHAIAEHWDAFNALSDIADGTTALIHFARLAQCPVLMVSYEKAIAFPDETLARIEAFCGLSVDTVTRARMRARISPNNADYAERARRTYQGFIERVDAQGRLTGWCRQAGEIAPVRLELLADDLTIASFTACLPRDDLAEAGLGNGHHGFAQPLPTQTLARTAKLRIRVEGTTWELPFGNRTFEELRGQPVATPNAPEPAAGWPLAARGTAARRGQEAAPKMALSEAALGRSKAKRGPSVSNGRETKARGGAP